MRRLMARCGSGAQMLALVARADGCADMYKYDASARPHKKLLTGGRMGAHICSVPELISARSDKCQGPVTSSRKQHRGPHRGPDLIGAIADKCQS